MMLKEYEVVLTTRALDKLSLIQSYLTEETGSPGIANKVVASLLDAAETLAMFPYRYSKIGIGEYRGIVRGNQRMVYRIDEEKAEVVVVTVFDTRQDPKSLEGELGG